LSAALYPLLARNDDDLLTPVMRRKKRMRLSAWEINLRIYSQEIQCNFNPSPGLNRG